MWSKISWTKSSTGKYQSLHRGILSIFRRKAGFTGAIAAVLLVTAFFKATAIANATTVGFGYLITILLIATLSGLTESVLASIIATTCFNFFFLPPVGTWEIADPENWVALFTFLVTSLIATQLSARAKRRTVEARDRQLEMERLYALSRAIMLTDATDAIGDHIAGELARIYEIPAVAIHDRISERVHYGGTRETPQADLTGVPTVPLILGGNNIGSLAIHGAEISNAALQALSNLVAISLENARSRAVATRAQAARQSEEFKSTLLDGLAHELKTPLTSIRAATTALLSSSAPDPTYRQALLTIVDQEAARLSELVREATQLARIEAGKLQLNKEPHPVMEIIGSALDQMMPRCDGRPVDVSIAPDLPAVVVDTELMKLALRQLIDNALKYSTPRSPIRISARMTSQNLCVSVHNVGEALSETEQVRIFDKFYRGLHVRQKIAGTGMGLPIAREILLAHGGDIRVESSIERGTEFIMALPGHIEVSA